jgi:dienelactone hydrolase
MYDLAASEQRGRRNGFRDIVPWGWPAAAQQQFGSTHFLMVGFCSGADVAHATALEDDRLRAIVMFDSYVYPNTKAKMLGLVHKVRRYGLPWVVKKAVVVIGRRLQRRSHAATAGQASEGPAIFGRTRMPARDDFGQRIRTLVDRGVELFFVYSGGEPDWYNYEGQFRAMFGRYGFVDRVAYEYLTQSDHTITQSHARDAPVERVERWLERRALPALQSARSATPTDAATQGALVAG